MGQDATAKVGPELLLDEVGSWLVSRARAGQERLELLANDPMRERLLGGSRRVDVFPSRMKRGR